MHDDPDKTLELPTDAPDHPANWQAPTTARDASKRGPYAKTSSPLTRPSLDAVALPLRPFPPGEPSEDWFALGMVVALLASLGLVIAKSDWFSIPFVAGR